MYGMSVQLHLVKLKKKKKKEKKSPLEGWNGIVNNQNTEKFFPNQ